MHGTTSELPHAEPGQHLRSTPRVPASSPQRNQLSSPWQTGVELRPGSRGPMGLLLNAVDGIGVPTGLHYSLRAWVTSAEVAWLWGVCVTCDIDFQASLEEAPDSWDYMDDMYPCDDDRLGAGVRLQLPASHARRAGLRH